MARWWLVVAVVVVICVIWSFNAALMPPIVSLSLDKLYILGRNGLANFNAISSTDTMDTYFFNGSKINSCTGRCSSLLNLQREKHEYLYDSRANRNEIKKFLVYGDRQPAVSMDFSGCYASMCKMIYNRTDWREADVIIITDEIYPLDDRPSSQIWMVLVHESPLHLNIVEGLGDKVNFTVTYRLDSTIYSSYGAYKPATLADYNPSRRYPLPSRNYAKGKTKMVAWFVSNCNAKSPRNQYVDELSNYISIDIYGRCGFKECLRSSENECFELLRKDYKFYLSFENSLCKDYVTEKFFKNALTNDVIPIVMGASIEEYKMIAPPYSFIHVDEFESPAKLADYLYYLNKNDTAYNEYFAWHGHGVIQNWIAQPQCDMCLLAHTAHLIGPSWYSDVSKWWNDGCVGRKLRWSS
uniref:Fucosyltransferase n=1 Tax=Trichobilharzia regenti TaxID=157069 RepID=A0AA85JCY9_TRIRE|nr:unnamed protein product [Trichobilharzia regenti]